MCVSCSNTEAVEQVLLDIDKQMCDNHLMQAGTTCAMAIIRGQHCTVVNIGDSRLVMLDHEWKVVGTMTDHRPCDDTEWKRIQSKGGDLSSVYVKAPHGGGGLAMSRALGDACLKKSYNPSECKTLPYGGVDSPYDGRNGLVSALPDVTQFSLDELRAKKVAYILLASDGIWDALDAVNCPTYPDTYEDYSKARALHLGNDLDKQDQHEQARREQACDKVRTCPYRLVCLDPGRQTKGSFASR